MEITIGELRKIILAGKIQWTTHVLMKIQERDIHPSDIIHCVEAGQIIENYPDDYPYPSCLVLGETVSRKPLHAVIGIGRGMAWLITAYIPDPEKWSDDFTTRKEHK